MRTTSNGGEEASLNLNLSHCLLAVFRNLVLSLISLLINIFHGNICWGTEEINGRRLVNDLSFQLRKKGAGLMLTAEMKGAIVKRIVWKLGKCSSGWDLRGWRTPSQARCSKISPWNCVSQGVSSSDTWRTCTTGKWERKWALLYGFCILSLHSCITRKPHTEKDKQRWQDECPLVPAYEKKWQLLSDCASLGKKLLLNPTTWSGAQALLCVTEIPPRVLINESPCLGTSLSFWIQMLDKVSHTNVIPVMLLLYMQHEERKFTQAITPEWLMLSAGSHIAYSGITFLCTGIHRFPGKDCWVWAMRSTWKSCRNGEKSTVCLQTKAGSEERGPGSYTGTAQSRTAVVLETQREKLAYRRILFFRGDLQTRMHAHAHTHTICIYIFMFLCCFADDFLAQSQLT